MTNLECSVCHYKRWHLSEGRAFVEHTVRNEVTGQMNKSGDLICYACLPDVVASGVFNELDNNTLVTERRGLPQRKLINSEYRKPVGQDTVDLAEHVDDEADYDGVECDRCGRQQNDDMPKEQRQTYTLLGSNEIICNDCYIKYKAQLTAEKLPTVGNWYNADPRS